jgi:Fe2+ or Zn2+ uptake regulation protein
VVVQALVGAKSTHVTADDLAARIRDSHPEVHRSTVYRTLESLERLGLADHVHLGHGRAIYHLAGNPHQHLVCEVCGRVSEVPEAFFAELSERARRNYGFCVPSRHFAVLGRCEDCVG